MMKTERPLTAKEKHYEHRLAQAAIPSLGPAWRDCWPDVVKRTRPLGYLAEAGPFASLESLMEVAEEGFNGPESVCFIDNITLTWSIILGAAWNLDPNFFISHVRPLSDDEATSTLHDCMVPNSKYGLKSSREKSWATVRGYVDHGKPKRPLVESDLKDSTKRRHAMSTYKTRQSHTNLSFYKVNDCTHVVLVDKVPDYANLFILDHLNWFPNQTIVRLGMLDGPGHITVPALGWTHFSGVFPIWTLFNDATDKALLLRCLREGAIDEFLYRATLFQSEREVLHVSLDIEQINDRQAAGGGVTADESLPNIQKVSTRLKSSIQENRAYEDKLRRGSVAQSPDYQARTEFEKLAVRFSELDNSLVQCFYRQMMTLTAAGTQENLRQTIAANKQAQATYEQGRSMSALSWVAFIYAPLTFVAGIFGMNIKEIDSESHLSWSLAALMALAFLSGTITVVYIWRAVHRCRQRRKLHGKDDGERGPKLGHRRPGSSKKDGAIELGSCAAV